MGRGDEENEPLDISWLKRETRKEIWSFFFALSLRGFYIFSSLFLFLLRSWRLPGKFLLFKFLLFPIPGARISPLHFVNPFPWSCTNRRFFRRAIGPDNVMYGKAIEKYFVTVNRRQKAVPWNAKNPAAKAVGFYCHALAKFIKRLQAENQIGATKKNCNSLKWNCQIVLLRYDLNLFVHNFRIGHNF